MWDIYRLKEKKKKKVDSKFISVKRGGILKSINPLLITNSIKNKK